MRAPITLLIPCYNAARYLPRLAECVRAQTVPFASILCYDDGSTDDTVTVARSLGWNILTPNQNGGPATARNRLLNATTSEWVHFHDADDLLSPNFVERMSGAIQANPAVDIAVCDMDWIDEVTHELRQAFRFSGPALAADALGETIRNPIGVIACVYRRATLLKIGGFDECFRTWEDGDLHVRLAAADAKFIAIPEKLSTGLRHQRGASADLTKVDSDRVRLLTRYAEAYPKCQTVFKEAEKLLIRLFEQNPRDPRVDQLLGLCKNGRHPVPTARHPVWQAARCFLPVKQILRLRKLARRLPI